MPRRNYKHFEDEYDSTSDYGDDISQQESYGDDEYTVYSSDSNYDSYDDEYDRPRYNRLYHEWINRKVDIHDCFNKDGTLKMVTLKIPVFTNDDGWGSKLKETVEIEEEPSIEDATHVEQKKMNWVKKLSKLR